MNRNTQLFSQHLEDIDRKALEQYQGIIREYVRGRQGIYVLYRKGNIYYVGLAKDLRTRLKHHLRDRHANSWDRFSVYLTIGGQHLRELEALMIRTIKPDGNRQRGNFARSEDLRYRFRQSCEALKSLEIDQLFTAMPSPARKPVVEKKQAGRKAVLAKYVDRPMILRARFKGKLIAARVRRDGSVLFNGKAYTSPSLPAAVACKRPSCNGWGFWKYQRAPGDWVLLDELRK